MQPPRPQISPDDAGRLPEIKDFDEGGMTIDMNDEDRNANEEDQEDRSDNGDGQEDEEDEEGQEDHNGNEEDQEGHCDGDEDSANDVSSDTPGNDQTNSHLRGSCHLESAEYFLSGLSLEDKAPEVCFCGQEYDEADHVAVRLPCSHILGSSCIRSWCTVVTQDNSNKCPFCRKEFFSSCHSCRQLAIRDEPEELEQESGPQMDGEEHWRIQDLREAADQHLELPVNDSLPRLYRAVEIAEEALPQNRGEEISLRAWVEILADLSEEATDELIMLSFRSKRIARDIKWIQIQLLRARQNASLNAPHILQLRRSLNQQSRNVSRIIAKMELVERRRLRISYIENRIWEEYLRP